MVKKMFLYLYIYIKRSICVIFIIVLSDKFVGLFEFSINFCLI